MKMPPVLESRIAVQYAAPRAGVPAAASLRRWAEAALAAHPGDVTLRVVGQDEGAALNKRYRGRNTATNVLSFPAALLPDGTCPIRGDLVLCAPVIAREVREQDKTASAHWAHMVVHGCLHLCGHDHAQDAEAAEMEDEERRILATLGYPDPYHEQEIV
ncbi:MAG: rRNA maturation RNase YbeY [Gammaproteobacteria bacterium]